MANRFRPIKATPSPRPEYFEVNTPKKQSKSRIKTTSQKKFSGKIGKKIRRAFVDVFGLEILKKINLQKNIPYFIMIIFMIICLIYNNLNIQSKKVKVERLEIEITKINDLLMDIVEKEYNIDEKREKELMQTAQEEGFKSGGYIPYTIKGKKKND